MSARRAFDAADYMLDAGTSLAAVGPSDAERLGQIFSTIDPWRRLQFSAQRLSGFIAEAGGGSARFAIRRDGKAVGFVSIEPAWLCGPYLHFLGVVPDQQGAGIGSAVLTWFVDQARQAGERNAWICVSAFNAGARRFYATQGFTEAACLDDLLRTGEAEILLRKQLFV